MMLKVLIEYRPILMSMIVFSTLIDPVQAQEVQNDNKYLLMDGTWSSFFQTIDASFSKDTLDFRLNAQLKSQPEVEGAYAAIWMRIDDVEGNGVFYANSYDSSQNTDDWQEFNIVGTLYENAHKIYIGGISEQEGSFFFDDFTFQLEVEKGKYKSALLENSSFEDVVKNGEIPGWYFGTKEESKKRIKGFSYQSTKSEIDDQRALLVVADVKEDSSEFIGPAKGYTPQIGILVSMLNNLKARVEAKVFSLSQKETDYLYDSIANSIGAMVIHLAAAEAIYQVYTFDKREYFNEVEEEKWGAALRLEAEAREKFQGKGISYYLDEYNKIRECTLRELKKKDDEWLQQKRGNGLSNFAMWYHVMEHQSSHLGQIRMQTKRYPKEEVMDFDFKSYR